MAAQSLMIPLVMGLLLLAGCEGGEGSEVSSSAPGAPTTSDTPVPTETSSATVEPAAGSPFRTNVVSMRLPEGWKVFQEDSTFWAVIDADRRRMSGGFTMFDGPSLGTTDLDKLARNAIRSGAAELEREDDLVVAGVEGYVLTGEDSGGDYVWQYGTVRGGNRVDIDFELALPEDEATALIESVLATWEWKG